MRQRLGLAMSLLSKPEFMVLDEPINGLDPEGIIDIRKMLSYLVQEEKMSILISSHILKELSELCTDYAIVNKGRLMEELSHDVRLFCDLAFSFMKCKKNSCEYFGCGIIDIEV